MDQNTANMLKWLAIGVGTVTLVGGGAFYLSRRSRGLPLFASRAQAWTGLLDNLRNAPHPAQPFPDALVHVPQGFNASEPLTVVVYYRGWSSCVSAIAAAERSKCRPDGPMKKHSNIVGQFDDAGINAILIMPELPVEQQSSDPGQLNRRDGLRMLVDEILQEHVSARVGRQLSVQDVQRTVLAAHSGGYYPTAVSIDRGGMPNITDVCLFDALYGSTSTFSRFARTGHFVSLFTGGDTETQTRALLSAIGGVGPGVVFDEASRAPTPEQWSERVLLHKVPQEHSWVPLAYFEPFLRSCRIEAL